MLKLDCLHPKEAWEWNNMIFMIRTFSYDSCHLTNVIVAFSDIECWTAKVEANIWIERQSEEWSCEVRSWNHHRRHAGCQSRHHLLRLSQGWSEWNDNGLNVEEGGRRRFVVDLQLWQHNIETRNYLLLIIVLLIFSFFFLSDFT